MFYITLILSILAMVFHLKIYLKRYIQVIPVSKHYKLYIALFCLFAVLPLFNFEFLEPYYGIRALLVLILCFVALSLIFKTNIITRVFLLFNYYMYIFTGFLFFSSIILDANNVTVSLNTVNDNKYYNLAYLLSFILSIIILKVLDDLVVKKKIISFLKHRKLLFNLIVIQAVLLLNSVFLVVEREVFLYLPWFNHSVITNTIAIYTTQVLTFVLSINISHLLEFKYYNKALKSQLVYQLNHYKKYEKYMESFAKFKHDHDKIKNAIVKLEAEKDYTKIINILKDSDQELENITKSYNKFSNNYIVDALMNEYNEKLKKIDCEINGNVTIPSEFPLSDYDMIKLFYNFMQNAYEALVKVNKYERMLTIESKVSNNFQIIEIKNSTNGLKYNFKTSKQNKILHGHGLKIIEDIVLKYGGFIEKEILKQDIYYFLLKLYIPIKID